MRHALYGSIKDIEAKDLNNGETSKPFVES